MSALGRFYRELKRRRVLKTGAAYGAGAIALWGAVQIASEAFSWPSSVLRAAVIASAVGFPAALLGSWLWDVSIRTSGPGPDDRASWEGVPGRAIALGMGSAILVFFSLALATGFKSSGGSAEESGSADPVDFTPDRVAVLYFDERGADDDLVSVGLTEALIDDLSGIDDLSVVSRNGSALFRGVTASSDSIARTLRAGLLVTGTVTHSTSRVRVDATLIRAATDEQVAAGRIEVSGGDLISIQDSLAAQVTRFLRLEIGRELTAVRTRERSPTTSVWLLVRQATRLMREAERQGTTDPELASSQLAVADSLLSVAEEDAGVWSEIPQLRGWIAYRLSRLSGFTRQVYDERTAAGLAHAQRALTLRPDDPDALELRATLHYWRYLTNLGTPVELDSLYRAAERGFRESVTANPRQASAWTSLSHLLLNGGRTAEAQRAALFAYENDPFLQNADVTLWRLYSSALDLQDREEAEKWCAEGADRFVEDYRFQQCQLTKMFLPGVTPNIDLAWSVLDRFVELAPASVRELETSRGRLIVGGLLAKAELTDSARSVIERTKQSMDPDPTGDLALWEAIAWLHARDRGRATEALSVYFSKNPGQRQHYRGELSWWFQDLAAFPPFRELVEAPSPRP